MKKDQNSSTEDRTIACFPGRAQTSDTAENALGLPKRHTTKRTQQETRHCVQISCAEATAGRNEANCTLRHFHNINCMFKRTNMGRERREIDPLVWCVGAAVVRQTADLPSLCSALVEPFVTPERVCGACSKHGPPGVCRGFVRSLGV